MAVKTEDPTRTTFTPLCGGRFRCNQTGDIVGARQTEAYRRRRANNNVSAPPKERPASLEWLSPARVKIIDVPQEIGAPWFVSRACVGRVFTIDENAPASYTGGGFAVPTGEVIAVLRTREPDAALWLRKNKLQSSYPWIVFDPKVCQRV